MHPGKLVSDCVIVRYGQWGFDETVLMGSFIMLTIHAMNTLLNPILYWE